MSESLSAAQTRAVSRIGGLVLVNALIYQEILSGHDKRVQPLEKVFRAPSPVNRLSEHWKFILDKINYYPIFHVAREILGTLTSSAEVVSALRELAETAQRVVEKRAALRHDLMGRVYHRLLAEAKYLGTYYTSIPAATLLMNLALRDAPIDVTRLDNLASYCVADLACGTGTLLMAAADSITDAHIRTNVEQGTAPDTDNLQRVLLQSVLHGYDVLDTAIHLTASTLALRAPSVTVTGMKLFSLPLGGAHHRLGSIEYLDGKFIELRHDLFGSAKAARHVTGDSATAATVRIASMDLCVMNPPFVRSVGNNLLFGSVPTHERKPMQRRLAKLLQSDKIEANSTAGLGSVFVALADKYLKPGGRLALVLPKGLLSGVAWEKTRRLLRRRYRVDWLVASHDPARWNFSESTDLSEVLVVATKLRQEKEHDDGIVRIVNLWKNPTTAFEALALDSELKKEMPDLDSGQGALSAELGDEKIAEAVTAPWRDVRTLDSWIVLCAFAQADLIRMTRRLLKGELWEPERGTVGTIELCRLDSLGSIGPDRRDIADGFNVSSRRTSYPAMWGQDASKVTCLSQQPNKHLMPLGKAKKGRSLRTVEQLWPLAGRLLIAERIRLNSSRTSAVLMNEPVLSNTWWPFAARSDSKHVNVEKLVALWLNSSLGIALILGSRLETEGPWIAMKKPVVASLPVPNVARMASGQLKECGILYDRVASSELLPLGQLQTDSTRSKIDDGLARILGIPSPDRLRAMLGREPIMSGERI